MQGKSFVLLPYLFENRSKTCFFSHSFPNMKIMSAKQTKHTSRNKASLPLGRSESERMARARARDQFKWPLNTVRLPIIITGMDYAIS